MLHTCKHHHTEPLPSVCYICAQVYTYVYLCRNYVIYFLFSSSFSLWLIARIVAHLAFAWFFANFSLALLIKVLVQVQLPAIKSFNEKLNLLQKDQHQEKKSNKNAIEISVIHILPMCLWSLTLSTLLRSIQKPFR